jgi:hypothetical protein
MSSGDERQLRRMTDDIVGAQARHRRHVRWAVVAGVVVTLAVAAPVAVVVSHPQTAGHPVAADQPRTVGPTSPPGRTRSATRPAAEVADQAQIYAVVIRGGSTSTSGNDKPIYVMDEFCTGLMDLSSGSRGPCEPGPIPVRLQKEIGRIAGPGVRFVHSAPQPHVGSPVVTIGTATIDGDRAQVTVDEECGPLCGQGETTVLTRQGHEWRVTGSTGPAWIS